MITFISVMMQIYKYCFNVKALRIYFFYIIIALRWENNYIL